MHQQFNKIIKSIWNCYFNDIVNKYIGQIAEGKTITISGVQISDKEVIKETKNLLNKKKISILWQHVGTKDYFSYYAIFSIENPTDIYCGYDYLDEWNVGVLYSVIETIKKNTNENQ